MQISRIKTKWFEGELGQNTYIVENENGCIVIDAGCTLKEIEQQTTKKIKAVFITHSHYDHVNFIEEFDKLDVPIYASKYAKKVLEDKNKNLSVQFAKSKSYKVKNLVEIEDNQIINETGCEIKCLLTPGHSKDSVSYLINDEILFSGDTLFSICVGRTDLYGGNELELVKSLEKLNNVNFKIMYAGHGRNSTKEEQNLNITKWISELQVGS